LKLDETTFPQARGVQYSIAIALLEPSDDNDTVTVNVTGVVCDDHKVLDLAKNECVEPAPFLGSAHNVDLNFNEVKYFTFLVARLTGSFQLASTSSDVQFSLRFEGNPQQSPDATGVNPSVGYPQVGRWFFAVTSKNVVNFNISSVFEDCSAANMTGGPGCAVPYEDVTDTNQYKMDIKAPTAGLWHYWRVVVNRSQPLWASVRSVTGEDMPSLYAAKDQLPTATTYHLKNCNFDYCDGANILKLNITSNETEVWFVGSTTDKINNTYGVWFNSVCAQECTEQNTGTCQTTEPKYGMCVCATPSLTGVDCTLRNGLPPEYIVLIIIAALVVASAIIGFVAWAYMRRKRVQYEHVTG